MTIALTLLLAAALALGWLQWLRARRCEKLCHERLDAALKLAELLIYERAVGPEQRRRRRARDYVRYTPPERVLVDLLGAE